MQTSFKDSARSELLGVLPQKRNEIIAFLSALAKTCGSIEIAKKRYNLCFWLADYDEGLKVVELLKILYPADFELSLDKTKTGRRGVFGASAERFFKASARRFRTYANQR